MNEKMEISGFAGDSAKLDCVELRFLFCLYGPYGPHDTKPRSKTPLVLIFLYI